MGAGGGVCASLSWRSSCCWARLFLKQSHTIEYESAVTGQRQDGNAGSPEGEEPAQHAKAAWLPLAVTLGTEREGCTFGR